MTMRTHALHGLALSLLVVGCGGGGSGPGGPANPVAGLTSSYAIQSGTGETLLAFRVALAANAGFPFSLNLIAAPTALNGARFGTACGPGVDYVIPAATGLTVAPTLDGAALSLQIPSAFASRQVNLLACRGTAAADLRLTMNWTQGSAGGSALGTIRGSTSTALGGSRRLNDTGITSCANDSQRGLPCPLLTHPDQDGDSGRDADSTITGDGANRTSAFILTAMNNGSCVQDNVTGLVWEGKTSAGQGGLLDADATFTWYNSLDPANNGGNPGTTTGGTCPIAGSCDTEKYVALVNAMQLCGFNDWRLPSATELLQLVDAGASNAPTVDARLAHQQAAPYWTATPGLSSPAAWVVDFNTGAATTELKSRPRHVRLVRG